MHICHFAAVVDLCKKKKTFFFFLGNHKLTTTAKVIIKICEHEVSRAIETFWT